MMRNNLPNSKSLFISRNNRQGLRDPLFLSFLIVIVGLMICCSPAAAHFGFENFDTGRGTVSAIDVSNQTLLIEDPRIYDYYYEHSEGTFSRFWHWVPMNLSEPGPCTYYSNNLSKISVIQPGDTVVVSFCEEKEWRGTIARLAGPGTEEAYVTDLFGNPAFFPVPFVGNISISVNLTPDCMRCNIYNICKARQAQIFLERDGTERMNRTLAPDDTMIYSGDDGARVTARFISGDTLYYPECGRDLPFLDGPSIGSNFIIHAEMPSKTAQLLLESTPGSTHPAEPTLTHSGTVPASPAVPGTTIPVSRQHTGEKAPGFDVVFAIISVIAVLTLLNTPFR